jgi:Domain of unknown function (DUF4396)
MEAHAEHAHHHEMPTGGNALTGLAVSATLHCLTGCAIGEVAGVAIGTALGFSNFATIVLAIALAFLFGYTLTSLPLLRAGLALAAVIPIALASDTLSIATMEVVDNAIILVVPGAMDAGLDTLLFWGSLAFALAVAFVLTVPVNRWLLARGKGHTAVHNTGIHGGPPTKVVGAAVIVGAVFGTAVLVGEALDGDDMGAHGESSMAMSADEPATPEHASHAEEGAMPQTTDATVPGLAVASNGLALELGQSELPQGEGAELSFEVVGADGEAITDYDVEHTKRMHLIVVRRDLTGFQHLHPTMSENGTWSTPVTLPDAGSYRVFADFTHDGSAQTLASDLAVDGNANYRELPAQRTEATTDDGYEVEVEGTAATAGEESELTFNVLRDGKPVAVEPYLGADGHLVALREGDLAFLHVHPVEGQGGNEITFMTEFPSEGSYRLFLQFRDRGQVHTAEFTQEVGR